MQQPDSTTNASRRHIIIASFFIFFCTMMSFINSANGDFVNWDDDAYIVENPLFQSPTFDGIQRLFTQTYYYAWIPITLLSHAIDVAVWGMNPKGHHLTNILLHSFNAVSFFLVCMALFDAARGRRDDKPSFLAPLANPIIAGAAVGALLFAVHPLRVEPVAWVSGRKDLLCAFFLLPSFGAYLRWKDQRSVRWFVASLVLFALGLLSKPMAAPFPLVLVLVDVFLMRNDVGRKNSAAQILKDKIPYFLLSVLAGVMTMLAASGGKVNVVGELNRFERIMLPAYSLCFYMWKLIVPLDLSPIYPELNRVLFYLTPVLLPAIAYGCFALLEKKQPAALITLSSYAIILLPTFLGLSSGMQPLADRYTYLSTIPIFIFVGGCVEWLWQKSAMSPGKLYQRKVVTAALLILCAVSSYRTIRHTAIWNNSVSLWTHALRYAPATREEFESDKPYMKPNYLDAYTNLGAAYYAADHKEKAIEQLNNALLLDNRFADAHYNLGNLLFEQGDVDGATVGFKNTIVCDSTYAKAYYNLGIIYAKKDSVEQAVESFRRAARLGFPDAQKVLSERGYSW